MTSIDPAATRRRHELHAAERQGLLGLLSDLERLGETAEPENTGGYCMVLTRPVLADDGTEEYVVASRDDRWYVARYTQAEWHQSDYTRRGLPIPHGFNARSKAAVAFRELVHDRMPHADSFEGAAHA